ncbi:hypothetical protein BG006_003791 [Podila minutissima]|uniref:Retrotransposon-derived protein PEG10 n=1 Tax=Podila minutissima TaxID=64525 RepID=A0A9P5STR1_9FUNG|nr:hypothetical protein BG006_003791 [Podila minutissima]
MTANQVYQRQIQIVLDGLFMRNAATRFQISTPHDPKFKGDDSEMPFTEFRAKLKIVAERFPDALHSNQERINYAIQSMEGAPVRFFAPFISGTADNLEGFLSSYSTFISVLNDMYGDQHNIDEINHKLARLCQTGIVTDHILQFRALASRADLNEPALLARFKDDLSSEVRTLLTAHPMEVDAILTKHISAEEKRHRSKNLCLCCAAADHFANDCTLKARLAAVTIESEHENSQA